MCAMPRFWAASFKKQKKNSQGGQWPGDWSDLVLVVSMRAPRHGHGRNSSLETHQISTSVCLPFLFPRPSTIICLNNLLYVFNCSGANHCREASPDVAGALLLCHQRGSALRPPGADVQNYADDALTASALSHPFLGGRAPLNPQK